MRRFPLKKRDLAVGTLVGYGMASFLLWAYLNPSVTEGTGWSGAPIASFGWVLALATGAMATRFLIAWIAGAVEVDSVGITTPFALLGRRRIEWRAVDRIRLTDQGKWVGRVMYLEIDNGRRAVVRLLLVREPDSLVEHVRRVSPDLVTGDGAD